MIFDYTKAKISTPVNRISKENILISFISSTTNFISTN
nr:MAG TPA: hypothetical protein [Caudoviricetes sp.]